MESENFQCEEHRRIRYTHPAIGEVWCMREMNSFGQGHRAVSGAAGIEISESL